MFKIATLLLAISVLLSVPLRGQDSSGVRIWTDKIGLPTYKTGAPDKNPVFYTPSQYQGAQRHIYPYPYIGELTNQKVYQEYIGVFLENEYLRICVTPQIGGRLYYAIDKTNNYNIVYYNHVVKPALIGMAGAWTSGGAEWNIPHHHRPTSFLPVDYTIVENPDGSKTVWVGEYEKRHQTRWLVGLTLEPGKAYIKTEFRYHNVTPLQNSFLFWANTAVHANENYQVIFPPDVEKAVFHAKTEFTNWPIANQEYQGIDFAPGEDISWWKSTSSPTSFFAWESKQDFIAGIDHGKRAGTVKIGDRFIFTGKKFWNWGPNEVGRRWDKKLTDNDGPYLELMMGAYSDNQPDYSFINPMASKRGTMFYYGIKNMDNIKEANKDFAVNLEQRGRKTLVQINATAVHEGLTVILSHKGQVVWQEKVSVHPGAPYSKEVSLGADVQYEKLRISLLSDGQERLGWQPAARKNEAHPDTYSAPVDPKDYNTNQALWLAGLRLEQFGNANFDPEKYYAEALTRHPDDILANTQLGLNYLKKGLYEKAEGHLQTAADRVRANHTKPKFGEPLYYLGVSHLLQEEYDAAREALYQAAWSYEWTSAAYTLLARIECLRKDWERAEANIVRAYIADPSNIEAINLKAMIMRHGGRYREAAMAAMEALRLDPLNFNTFYELHLLSTHADTGKDGTRWMKLLRDKLRDEPDNYLETASRYGHAGFFTDAIDFLRLAADSENAGLANAPMIYYHLGYYYSRRGDHSSALEGFREASEKSIEYCFPYGITSERALSATIAINTNDANAHYLLGNVYANYQPRKAIAHWQKAVALDSSEAIFFRNLAFAQANYTPDIEAAIENMKEAISLAPDDPGYFSEADNYMLYARMAPEQIRTFLTQQQAPKNDFNVQATRARLNIFFGEYDEAIDLLENTDFRTEEGASFNIHVYWFDAHLLRCIQKMQGKDHAGAEADLRRAVEFPANLESERNAKIGIAHYYRGLNDMMQGKRAEAKKHFARMVTYAPRRGWGAGSFQEIDYYRGLACMELGDAKKADGYFQQLIKTGEDDMAHVMRDHNGSSGSHGGSVTPTLAHRRSINEAAANALYIQGLGHQGKGDHVEAQEKFAECLVLNPSHLWAKVFTTPQAE